MEKLIFNLPYNDKKIHRQIVKFLNFAMGLTDQEQIVVAKLIEYNIEYKALDPLKRAKFIFSTGIKKEICEDIDMKMAGLTQIILRLKKKKFFNNSIIDENGILHKSLIITPDEEGLSIIVSFINRPVTTIETSEEPIIEETVVISDEPTTDQSEVQFSKAVIPTDYEDPMEGVEFDITPVSKD